MHEAWSTPRRIRVVDALLVAEDLHRTLGESVAGLMCGLCHFGLHRVGAFLAFSRCDTIGKGVFFGGNVRVVRVVERHSLFCGNGSLGTRGGFLRFVRVGSSGCGGGGEALADWGARVGL